MHLSKPTSFHFNLCPYVWGEQVLALNANVSEALPKLELVFIFRGRIKPRTSRRYRRLNSWYDGVTDSVTRLHASKEVTNYVDTFGEGAPQAGVTDNLEPPSRGEPALFFLSLYSAC